MGQVLWLPVYTLFALTLYIMCFVCIHIEDEMRRYGRLKLSLMSHTHQEVVRICEEQPLVYVSVQMRVDTQKQPRWIEVCENIEGVYVFSPRYYKFQVVITPRLFGFSLLLRKWEEKI